MYCQGKIILLKNLAIILGCGLLAFFPSRITAQAPSRDSTIAAFGVVSFDQPIDPDLYLIRPGERLIVTPIKAGLAASELVVGPEGKIIDARIGVIDVNGMTLSQVRTRLEEPLAGQFRSAQIIVSIAAPRQVSMAVTGAVQNPGNYLMYTSQRVSDAIAQAGGLRAGASTRRVELTAGPRMIIADLDKARYGRNSSADLPLYAGAGVFVPMRSSQTVRLAGEVQSPREVELVEGDTRNDLTALVGGILPTGDSANSFVMNDPERSLTDRIPRAGDLIVVPIDKSFLAKRGVVVSGAVLKPGAYRFRDGMTFDKLIEEAGGKAPGASTNRAVIFRRGERLEPGSDTLRRTPIGNLYTSDGKPREVVLKPLDSLYVPAAVGVVRIGGLIRRPGLFPYDPEQSAAHYISAAGGLATSANRIDVSIRSRVTGQVFLASPESIVEDGDEVLITSSESRP
jgi:protein involved in polysaccharide export with SLBB domain